MLEICEIGEQGVSFVGFELLVSFTAESLLKLQLNLQPFQRKLPTVKAAFAVSISRLLMQRRGQGSEALPHRQR